jgi:phospholipid/cholesterol/gamma-HCH transport system substrate-binding protein
METKANHIIIGAFVIAVIGLAFGFVYWMKNSANGGGGKAYHVIFDGSVQGLAEASSVLFNGIRVGAVDALEILPEDTRKVRALITVRDATPVRSNSRARISQQGLAGLVALEITPGTPDAPPLTARNGEALPVIYADPGGGGAGLSGLGDAIGSAQALLARLNDLVANNEDTIRRTLKNVESVTAVLDENKDSIASLIREVQAAAARVNALAGKLETSVEKLTDAVVDGDQSFVAQAQQAAISFRKLADKLDKTIGDQADGLTRSAQRSLREFELFMKDARRLADNIDRVVQKVEKDPAGFLLGGSQTPEYKPSQ